MTVHLTITTRQEIDGQRDETVFDTVGEMTLAGSTATLTYTEESEDGAKTAVTVTCTADEVTVQRVGLARSTLRMRRGTRCDCEYATPYGTFPVTTHTHRLQNALAVAGRLELDYTLTLGGGEVHNHLQLTTRPLN